MERYKVRIMVDDNAQGIGLNEQPKNAYQFLTPEDLNTLRAIIRKIEDGLNSTATASEEPAIYAARDKTPDRSSNDITNHRRGLWKKIT